MTRYEKAKQDFETFWPSTWRVFALLCTRPEDGKNVTALVSLVKALAFTAYVRGRTDELAHQIALSKRLTRILKRRGTQ